MKNLASKLLSFGRSVRRQHVTRGGTRAGQSLKARRLRLDPLEERTLLSATVWTDHADYAPGSTAVLKAAGFLPGEAIQLQVTHTDGALALGNNPMVVKDGDNSFTTPYQDAIGTWHAPDLDGKIDGNIQTTWYVNPTDETNATMNLAAKGLSSGETAETTFTDSATHITTITTTGTAGTYQAGAVFSMVVTFSGTETYNFTAGHPYLALNTTPNSEQATYVSSTTTTMTFSYTVGADTPRDWTCRRSSSTAPPSRTAPPTQC